MRKLLSTILLILVGLACLQCSKTMDPKSDNNSPDPNPIRTPADMTAAEKSLAESTNRFSLKLFKEVASAAKPEDNIFISPLSVSYALGMAYNGAGGDTREEIASTLELAGLSIEEINEAYQGLTTLLTGLDPDVAFSIANSIWYRDGVPVEPTFIELNRKYFDALVRGIDFNAIWAADTINHWIDVNTNGLIKEVIVPPIPPLMMLYLINAIYFKGNWTVPFDTSMTHDIPFYLHDGTSEPKPAMLTDTTFQYCSNDLFQAIELPYGNKYFCMTIFLPRPEHTVDEIISQINDENWSAWIASFTESKVYLDLPKFKMEYDKTLNQMLKAMGMPTAFDPYAADFNNMVANFGLFISFVKHKTFVRVDEKGTEAAAVTVIAFETTGGPQRPMMIISRPFLFTIRERVSGTILFMGRIVNPEWGE
jgi:serpin B